jgi:hypothetical protein
MTSKSLEEPMATGLEAMSAEQRLRGLSLEERLVGLARDELEQVVVLAHDKLAELDTMRRPTMKYDELIQKSLEELMEPVLEAMPAEQRLEGLAPEQRLQGLAPEQRLQGLTPEQLSEGLTPEQLAATIDALPAEVREQIKRRLH